MTFLTDGARRRRALLPALAIALLLAACGGTSTSSTPSTSVACVKADANNVVQLTAANIAFSAPCIEVPAGVAFTIEFQNNDSVPHDFAAYQDSTKATQVMKGDVADAGQHKTYNVPALAAGDHYFECTIHTGMNGVLRAVPGAAASGS